MVLKKRLDYGPSGFHVPFAPKGPRSFRRPKSFKKQPKDRQICAFELLATIAGKLLQDCESSSVSSNDAEVKQELLSLAPINCIESAINSTPSNTFFHVENNCSLENTSTVTKSEYSEKLGTILHANSNNDDVTKAWVNKSIGSSVTNYRCNKSPLGLHNKYSDNIVDLTNYKNLNPNASFHKHKDDVNVGIRDDDENSYRCKPNSTTKVKAYRPSLRVGDYRLRKMLTSKSRNVHSRLKDYNLRNTSRGESHVFRSRKTYYSREKIQHDRPFKKRKLFGQSSVVISNGGIIRDTNFNSPDNDLNESNLYDLLHEDNKVLSTVRSHRASFHSVNSHVRFSIKSFRVPELSIEVPINATVGSLKRTVMEAVAAIIHGGLDVGVLLRGKKVEDDDKTLLQSGISQNGNLDTLGFILEPGSQAPSPLLDEDSPFILPCNSPQYLTRLPATKLFESGDSDASYDPSPVSSLDNHVDSDYVPSPNSLLTDNTKKIPETRILVHVPPMNVEALTMVPMNQKTKRSEHVQRRIRRPFSVSEVEALVHAVEKLGTGRWRDVKLLAFDNANHRTYVDLKDKWKTLVHTAQISLQQRRGEPVPQELLDRVLAAHSYWCHHQAKHYGKPQSET